MKFYADKSRSERTFLVGDWVYMKLQKYRQATVRHGLDHKLAALYYGPFQVRKKIGKVAYQLRLPLKIHNVFDVSLLKRKVATNNVEGTLPDHGELEEPPKPVTILDKKMAKQGNKAITKVLVQWSNASPDEATWETLCPPSQIPRPEYPQCLSTSTIYGRRFCYRELRIPYDDPVIMGLLGRPRI